MERRGTSLPVDSAPLLPPPAVPLDDGELRALLILRRLPGVGAVKLLRLLRRYGSGQRALDRASAGELGAPAAAERAGRRHAGYADRAVETLRGLGVHVVRRGEAAYPLDFNRVEEPPYLIYLRGRLELLEGTGVAIVGSRRHSDYGARTARALAADLARAGVVVVSGLARGIDTAAHHGALETGATIGVPGAGIDIAYPRSNERLHERIAREGLLLTEFDPCLPPMGFHFPRRNRLLAALAQVVVVVEAGRRSGTSITVDWANRLGRDVMAVPGQIGRSTSEGTHRLLHDGAKFVGGVADIFKVLGLDAAGRAGGRADGRAGERTPAGDRWSNATGAAAAVSGSAPPNLGPEPLAVWQALDADPLHVDSIAGRARVAPAQALSALLELELRGVARQLPGMRFARVAGPVQPG